MSLQSKLQALGSALNDAFPSIVFHYHRPVEQSAPFVVWAEDSESGAFDGDNRKAEQTIHGTVDLYTATEFDPRLDTMQATLLTAVDGWTLSSVQYEEETKLIHYEWEWVFING